MLDDTSIAWLAAIDRGDTTETDRLGAVLDTADQLERTHPTQSIRDAALAYAKQGIALFPVHGITNGHCTCGRATCRNQGKHPLTENGLLDATTDLGVVANWWSKWPLANVGFRTGLTFDVVDVDGAVGVGNMYGGPNPLIGDFEIIGTVRTGRDGGRHLYIPVTGRHNGTALVPGVDFRGEGGYVIAPPSLSLSGRRYQWATPLDRAGLAAAA